MVLKWKDGYEEFKAFGVTMCGVHRDNERPIEIVVSPYELFTMSHDNAEVMEYIYKELLTSAASLRIEHVRST